MSRAIKQWKLTDLGRKLADTTPGSAEERDVLREALLSNVFIAGVVTAPEIDIEALRKVIRDAGFTASSVNRRLPCLRQWRKWFRTDV